MKEKLLELAQLTKIEFSKLQPNPPEILYHYTSAGGLLGIINSQRIWATNYRFLNDSSELSYGMNLLKEILETKLSDEIDNNVTEFLRRLIRGDSYYFDCYISCFCEKDDLLNQWRDYAGSGGGFALGFESRKMWSRPGSKDHTQNFIMFKVIYDEDQQRKIITDLLDATIRIIRESASDIERDTYLLPNFCSFLNNTISQYLITFKHPSFSIEEEWRLCHTPGHNDDDHVLFREGVYGLTPYVCLDPSQAPGTQHNHLPICQITHSPTADPDSVKFALRKFAIKKHPWVKIEGSQLPIRIGR